MKEKPSFPRSTLGTQSMLQSSSFALSSAGTHCGAGCEAGASRANAFPSWSLGTSSYEKPSFPRSTLGTQSMLQSSSFALSSAGTHCGAECEAGASRAIPFPSWNLGTSSYEKPSFPRSTLGTQSMLQSSSFALSSAGTRCDAECEAGASRASAFPRCNAGMKQRLWTTISGACLDGPNPMMAAKAAPMSLTCTAT
jgi:hypothetical protein